MQLQKENQQQINTKYGQFSLFKSVVREHSPRGQTDVGTLYNNFSSLATSLHEMRTKQQQANRTFDSIELGYNDVKKQNVLAFGYKKAKPAYLGQ